MTTTLTQDLASDLRDEQHLLDYVAARVRGDTNRAPPPIDRYHGIEDYEDVLVSLIGDPTLTDNQRRWFWNAVWQVAKETWWSGDNEPFRRIVALAWRVTPPADGLGRLDFLPNNREDFQWDNEKRLLVSAHALLWLLVWKARPDPGFWRENLKAILEQAPPGDNKYLALVRAVDGLGTLDQELWFALIRDALRAERFPASMMRTALLGQWQRTGHDPATEIRLVQTVGESLAKARQIPERRSSWGSLLQLLEEWNGVQWTETAQRELHKLMRENRLWITQFQGLNDPRNPLSQLSESDRELVLPHAARTVRDLARSTSVSPVSPNRGGRDDRDQQRFELPIDPERKGVP